MIVYERGGVTERAQLTKRRIEKNSVDYNHSSAVVEIYDAGRELPNDADLGTFY